MRKPSFLLCVKCPRYEWKVIRENRGTHGVSSLMLSTLVLSNEKPLPLCVSIGGGSMSLSYKVIPYGVTFFMEKNKRKWSRYKKSGILMKYKKEDCYGIYYNRKILKEKFNYIREVEITCSNMWILIF